jgi:hypothetical protein
MSAATSTPGTLGGRGRRPCQQGPATRGDDVVTVLLPKFVTTHWWQQFLHNQPIFLLKTALLYRTGIVVSSVPYHLRKPGFLLLRIHVSGLAVPVRILAMVVSRGSVLRGFFVVAVILLLGRLAVLFHRCFRLRSRLVLLLAGWLFLFLSHGMSP